MQAMDLDTWASTTVGALHAWPPALRTAAQLCLTFPTPCCVLWGERSQFLYNDAMAASIGRRHPSGMGHPLYDVIPAAWRTVGPIVHEVMRTGRPFAATRFPLQLEDARVPVQLFVDFTLVPVHDDEGRVLGVFAPVGSSTRIHLDNQHHAAVAAIATIAAGLPADAVAAQVARHLAEPDDVRFAVVFRPDPETGRPTRVAAAGAPLRPASSLAALDVAVSRGLWPLEQAMAERRGPERIGSGPEGTRSLRPLWQDAWLVALPEPAAGVLVLGLDARFGVPEGPTELLTRLARVAGERLAR